MDNERIIKLLTRLSELDSDFCKHFIGTGMYDRFEFSDESVLYEDGFSDNDVPAIQNTLLTEIMNREWWVNICNPSQSWIVQLANDQGVVSGSYDDPCLTIALLECFVMLLEKIKEQSS